MTTTGARAPKRRLVAKVAAPVLSQGITAGTSLVLQVLAARTLGLAEFGSFVLLLALLVTAIALYTGWVGDSLAVLDRHEPRTRAGIVTSALAGWVLCFAAAVGTALLLRDGEPATALAFGTMVVLRLAAEAVRRLLMARLQFWHLVGNDIVHVTGTLLALAPAAMAGVSLPALFLSMAVGAAAAVFVGVVQLPAAELRQLRAGTAGLPAVMSFAAWRSLQAALRPAALLGSRALVALLVSTAAVGMLEAGRLVVAPLQVVINGAGSFLLSNFVAKMRRDAVAAQRLVHRATWLLITGTGVGGVALTLLANPLGILLTGQAVDPLLVLGWVAYLMIWAAGLPHVTELVARQMSRHVFLVRLADSALGLVLVAIATVRSGSVIAVPWLMACAGIYSAWHVRRLAIRSRREARTA
ncbi:hypothetical protein ACWEV3_20205 [Saccharopolyspora sp. NPDC003752]